MSLHRAAGPRLFMAANLFLQVHAFAAAAPPYTIERFARPGPMAGVLVRLDLSDPRVKLSVALADARDPDGPGPMAGRLNTITEVARSHDFAITLNGGYFKVAESRRVDGRQTSYFTGNGAAPAGWHFSGNKLISAPAWENLRATVIVHESGAVSLMDEVRELPPDTRFAVSGNAMMLAYGVVNPPARNHRRHPRSAVGISADGRTLLLAAVDGRQDGHSRGASLGELASLLLHYGAWHAINLDGGDSTSLVLKDPDSGEFTLLNRPSARGGADGSLAIERPIADVIGVHILPEAVRSAR